MRYEFLSQAKPRISLSGVQENIIHETLRTLLRPVNVTSLYVYFNVGYLRNKFHFAEVHGIMNAMGPVQS